MKQNASGNRHSVFITLIKTLNRTQLNRPKLSHRFEITENVYEKANIGKSAFGGYIHNI